MSAYVRVNGGRPPTTVGVRKLVPELSRGVVCVILRLAVLVQCRLVTDRQTDGQTDTMPACHRQTHDDG